MRVFFLYANPPFPLSSSPLQHHRALPPLPSLCTCANITRCQVFENNRLVVSDYGLLTMKSIREKCSSEPSFFGKKRPKGTPPPPPPAGSGSEEAVQWRGEKEPWVAPEVSAGGEHTQQSDLYSYGGVLFEASFLFDSISCLIAIVLAEALALAVRSHSFRQHSRASKRTNQFIYLSCHRRRRWYCKR